MTPHEKLALKSIVSLTELTASLLEQDAASLILMADHLPDLTEEEKGQLRTDAQLRLKTSQSQKENAKSLASVVERGM
jgi:hypothetical protein